ncbi:ABC transporter permease [Falsarthrobacter nasiphocae]|uniref:D-methionine transport system permease protein n=2 Tax=Falsarthrobacter nasiphocae TaxID=189863 RepID=A0AAE3YEK0_9MICC|nr:D-methionine transport system permease protein [Falsarthrobacter nasiphocae]
MTASLTTTALSTWVPLAANDTDWNKMRPALLDALQDTLYMVSRTLLFAGILGLIVGLLLYCLRPKGILGGSPVARGLHLVLNLIINTVRPIPFIILLVAVWPLTEAVVGKTIGPNAAVFVMTIGATFAVARIVEQNLMSVDPGVIEAARSMGAKPWQIIRKVILPEALGPLVLGYTFLLIGIVDMSAMAGAIGSGGLGNFAIMYGYQQFNTELTWVAVAIIIVLVQIVQFFGNWLARKIMRR